MDRVLCSYVVLLVLRQAAQLCEIRYSWKVGQHSQSDWVPSLARLMNKIFCTFFCNCAPSWTADISTYFKICFDGRRSLWPKCGPSGIFLNHLFVAFYFNSLHIRVRWWNGSTLHLLCARSPEKTGTFFSVLIPCSVLCPIAAGWCVPCRSLGRHHLRKLQGRLCKGDAWDQEQN